MSHAAFTDSCDYVPQFPPSFHLGPPLELPRNIMFVQSVALGDCVNLHAHEGVIENASLASGNWPNKSICRLSQGDSNHVAICKRVFQHPRLPRRLKC